MYIGLQIKRANCKARQLHEKLRRSKAQVPGHRAGRVVPADPGGKGSHIGSLQGRYSIMMVAQDVILCPNIDRVSAFPASNPAAEPDDVHTLPSCTHRPSSQVMG